MKQHSLQCLILIIITIFMLNSICLVDSYSETDGIEYDDIIDVAFISYRNGEFVIEYTAQGPIRLEINTNAVNEYFVNEVLGMKIGEVKPYITWNVGADLIEYFNTTIVNLVKDSTPETSTPSPTETSTFSSIKTIDFFWGIIVVNFISISLLKRKKNRRILR